MTEFLPSFYRVLCKDIGFDSIRRFLSYFPFRFFIEFLVSRCSSYLVLPSFVGLYRVLPSFTVFSVF